MSKANARHVGGEVSAPDRSLKRANDLYIPARYAVSPLCLFARYCDCRVETCLTFNPTLLGGPRIPELPCSVIPERADRQRACVTAAFLFGRRQKRRTSPLLEEECVAIRLLPRQGSCYCPGSGSRRLGDRPVVSTVL